MGLLSTTGLPQLLKAATENWALTTAVITAGGLALYVVQTLRAWYRLRHIKGPRLAGFTNLWMMRTVASGRQHEIIADCVEKHGPIVRIGPNEVVTSDPTLLRKIFAMKSGYKRSNWYNCLRVDGANDNVLSIKDNDVHNKLRAKMVPGYSGKDVEAVEASINRNLAAFIDLIRTKYTSTPGHPRPFDMGRKAQFFTLDVISDISYSEPFGCIPSDSDILGYIASTDESLDTVMLMSTMPRVNDFILTSPLLKVFLPSDSDKLGFGRIRGLCKEKAAERYGPDKVELQDMLGSFVRHGLTQRESESETMVQILAGSDTTATAIRSTFMHIITNPRVYSKLVAEITAASEDIPFPISDATAKTLPYLQAVIKEGLRVWPPVTGVTTKIVPPQGENHRGTYIPAGTELGWSAFGLSRNREVWGGDARMFRPERWLEATKEEFRVMESTLDLVFSGGRWQCLGRGIALMELNKIFFEMLRHFDINVVDPTKVWNSRNAGLFLQRDFWLMAYEREA